MKRKRRWLDKKSSKIVPLLSTAMTRWFSQTQWRPLPETTSQRRSKEGPESTVDSSLQATTRRVSVLQLRPRPRKCISWTRRTLPAEAKDTSSSLWCLAWCAALLTARLSQLSPIPRGQLAPRTSSWETSSPMMKLSNISEIWTWSAPTCQMSSFLIRNLSLGNRLSRRLLT